MSSSSEIDLDLTQPFEPSLEVDKSCNDEQLESDDDIFFMSTQPLQECNKQTANNSGTEIVSKANVELHICVEDSNRQQGTTDVLYSSKYEISDMETQLFDVQLPTHQNRYPDPKISPLINGKKKLTSRASRRSSRMRILHQTDDSSNNIFIDSSGSDDEMLLNQSDYRTSNPIHLVQETPLNRLKRDILNISTEEEDRDATQKCDGFICNESNLSNSFLKEMSTTVSSLVNIQEISRTSNFLCKKDETNQLPQDDRTTAECTSPVLFEDSLEEDCDLTQRLDITEPETQLFTPPRLVRTERPLNKVATENFNSASKPISSTKNSSNKNSDSMPLSSPILLTMSQEDNVRSSNQKLDISEADTQLFGNISTPFDLEEVETQPIVGTSLFNRKANQENAFQSSPTKVLDITEAETQPFVFSPPQVSKSKSSFRGNHHISSNTKQKFGGISRVSQESSNSDTPTQRQEIITSPDEDSNDDYPPTQKLELSTVSLGEDLSDNHPDNQKSVTKCSEDSSDDYPPTQKLVLPEYKDSNDNHSSTQKFILPESEGRNYHPTQILPTDINTGLLEEDSNYDYPAMQKLVLPGCEDSNDKCPTSQKIQTDTSIDLPEEDSNDDYPATQKLILPGCEDSSDKYPPTQKLVTDINTDIPEEDSNDDYPATQKLVFPGCEDSNDKYTPIQKFPTDINIDLPEEDSNDDYPATQKLVLPGCEDSNDKYPPIQKLPTDINIDLPEEDSNDDYPATQKLVLPDCEDSNDQYPPTQKFETEINADLPEEDSNDDYPATQKLVLPDCEDSNDKYPPTQKFETEINTDLTEEDSNDNYPVAQELILPECENSNDKYPPTQKLVTNINTDLPEEDLNDSYPATQKLVFPGCEDSNDKSLPNQQLVTETNTDLAEENSNDDYPATQKLVLPGCEDSNDNYPPAQKLETNINCELIEEDSNGDYPATQRLILGSNHSNENNLHFEGNVSPKKPVVFEALESDQNESICLDSDNDLTQPQSPVLNLGCFDFSQVPSLKYFCSKVIDSRRIQIKFPMLCKNKDEPDSSAMEIETQLLSPVFIFNSPADRSLKSGTTNLQTVEDQAIEEVDSSSMDIEPPSFTTAFPPTTSQETGFKPETNQQIDDDIHHLLRSSTPIPDDFDKPPIKRNIVRKSDLVSGKKMTSDNLKTVAVEKAADPEDWSNSDSDFEVSFGSCLTAAVPPEPFVGFTSDDTALSSKRMSTILNAIVDEKRELLLPSGPDNDEENPVTIKVENIKKEIVFDVPSNPRRLRSSQSKGVTSMTTRSKKSNEEFKAPSRSVSLSNTRNSTRIQDRRGASAVIRRSCKDSSPVSISDGHKTNESICGTIVKKRSGRPKKELGTEEGDLSVKEDLSMMSRCSVSSTERSPTLSQSRGRKRSRNNNNSTTACSSQISDTPARRKKRALAGLVRVLFTGYDDENDRQIVFKLGGQVVETSKHCSVLVTDKIRRTVKFLCAVGLGLPIVGPSWLQRSLAQGKFIDPWQNILEDRIGEDKFDFNLSTSLHSACETPFLAGWIFHVTPSVLPPPPQMQEIIESCGGFYVEDIEDKSVDNKIVISCDQDKSSWAVWRNKDATLVSTEAILSGVLKQRFEPEKFKL